MDTNKFSQSDESFFYVKPVDFIFIVNICYETAMITAFGSFTLVDTVVTIDGH